MLQVAYHGGASLVELHARGPAPLVSAPMSPSCDLCVIIPARDERDAIADALHALADQRDLDGAPFGPSRYEAIVLANNCADDTVDVALRAHARYPELALHVVEARFAPADSHVGSARRLLMDEAAARFRRTGRTRGVIVSTDADSQVDPHWMAGILEAVDGGADAVGGRITVATDGSPAGDVAWSRYHLRDVGYRMLACELDARIDPDPYDPWPRHFQHFGPSLAVTAEAYVRAGGMPECEALEDVALYKALRRIDARIRHDPRVRVVTSARHSSRTSFGFSFQLRAWSRMERAGIPMCVPSAAAIEAHAVARRILRQTWQQRQAIGVRERLELNRAAELLAVEPEALSALTFASPTFGCLSERIEAMLGESPDWIARHPAIDVREAIAGLRDRLADVRAGASPTTLGYIEPVEVMSMAD